MGAFEDIKREIGQLRTQFELAMLDVSKVKGQPIIQGYQQKRLDLNDSLNVLNWKKRLDDIETAVADLYTNAEIDALLQNIDLSNYYTKAQVDARINALDARISALEGASPRPSWTSVTKLSPMGVPMARI